MEIFEGHQVMRVIGKLTVVNDPMTAYNLTINYNGDKVDTLVLTGGGKTKTVTAGYTGDKLTSLTTVLT